MDGGDTCRISPPCVFIADAVIIRNEGCKSAAFYVVRACLILFPFVVYFHRLDSRDS